MASDPSALASLPGLKDSLTAALAKPKLVEAPGQPNGSLRFEVAFPEVSITEAEPRSVGSAAHRCRTGRFERAAGGRSSSSRFPVPWMQNFSWASSPDKNHSRDSSRSTLAPVNTTITVYNGSVIRQLPLYEDQLERLREEFEAWFRADPACAMPGVPEGQWMAFVRRVLARLQLTATNSLEAIQDRFGTRRREVTGTVEGDVRGHPADRAGGPVGEGSRVPQAGRAATSPDLFARASTSSLFAAKAS